MAYGYRRRFPQRRTFRRNFGSSFGMRRRFGSFVGSPVISALRQARNDMETRVMTFKSHFPVTATVATGTSGQYFEIPSGLVFTSGVTASGVNVQAGRLFFAGMMYDRMRIRMMQITLIPLFMPQSQTNITIYGAVDRYFDDTGVDFATAESVMSDPSCRQIILSSGGGTRGLWNSVFSAEKDRYQYLPIGKTSTTSWTVAGSQGGTSNFYPTFRYVIQAPNSTGSPVTYSFTAQCTLVLEFQGAASVAGESITVASLSGTSYGVEAVKTT